MTDRCKHCGARIVHVRYSWRPRWMHQPAEASFQDGMYEYCRLTVAEPDRACWGAWSSYDDARTREEE